MVVGRVVFGIEADRLAVVGDGTVIVALEIGSTPKVSNS